MRTSEGLPGSPALNSKWPPAHTLLALPGVLAGAGGVVIWVVMLAERAGITEPPGLLQVVLLPVVVAGGMLAGWGGFLAVPFVGAGFLLALSNSLRGEPGGPRLAAWKWTLLGAAGTVLAWTAMPRLL